MEPLNSKTSVYLDLVRVVAAIVVLLNHAALPAISTGIKWFPRFGYEMVMVFFVLSGFVITYAAQRKPGDWRRFSADRLSRLYSVVVPALVLTAVLDAIGRRYDPHLYESLAPSGKYWERFLISVPFLHQSWGLAARPGSNGPFWSLAYEFWYYAAFAAALFPRKFLNKIWLCLLVAVFAGPKILLLLPVWLLGVACYYACAKRFDLGQAAPWLALLSLLSLLAILFGFVHLPFSIRDWEAAPPLYWSTRFLEDYQIGLLVALHFFLMDAWLRTGGKERIPGQAIIRFLANRTFSVYVFHFPILVFLRAVISYDPSNGWQVCGIIGLALVIMLLLSEVTEMRRGGWRSLCYGLLRVPDGRKQLGPSAEISSGPI